MTYWLVVVWNMTGLFLQINWECHHTNWRSHIFQMGRSTTNQFWSGEVENETSIGHSPQMGWFKQLWLGLMIGMKHINPIHIALTKSVCRDGHWPNEMSFGLKKTCVCRMFKCHVWLFPKKGFKVGPVVSRFATTQLCFFYNNAKSSQLAKWSKSTELWKTDAPPCKSG